MDLSLSHLIAMPISFYYVAIPAVLLTGIAKGGLGGALAMLGTPFIATIIDPVQAAAIMLPILLCMDVISVYNYWRFPNWSVLRTMLPGAMVGIFIGWATASLVSAAGTKIIIGMIAVIFAIYLISRELRKLQPSPENRPLGAFWGMIAGFTSFIAHAGGPPFQAYTLALKMPSREYVATSVMFFAIVNLVKVLPYFALGEFTPDNLNTSLSLFPIAIIGVFIGIWGVRKLPQHIFYTLTYLLMFVIGAKLVYDGISGL